MAHLAHRPYTAWECVVLAALPIGLVVLLPILGVLAFALRGAALAAGATAGAGAAAVALWRAAAPHVRSALARRRALKR